MNDHSLRMCRAKRACGGLCRAWAVNNGYCWWHMWSVFNTVMWGDHTWR